MSTKYCDRAFLTINGARIADLQTASLKMNANARVVPSMTRDKFNRGFVQGNTDIDVTCTVAVQNLLASPKLEAIDYESNDIGITFEAGSDVYTVSGVFLKDTDQTAGGIGDEVKKTWNFGALKVVDAVGNSALFNLSL
jgi:hypothetical protein